MRKLVFSMLLTWSCLGCFVLPVPTEPRTLEGQRSASLDTSFLQEGRTTRGEAAARWGPPTVWLQAQRIAVYGAVYTDTEILYGAGTGRGGSVPLHKREAVYLAFDAQDQLTHWGAGRVKSGATWLSAALGWARSAGLQVREPAPAFLPAPPPAGGRVYFFCRKHPKVLGEPLPVVALEGLRLGQVRKRTYLAVELPAGDHEFTINPLSLSFGTAAVRIQEVPLSLQPGAVAYVEFHVEADAKAVFSVACAERQAQEALPVLQTLRETW